jgi:ribosomal protein L37E
MAIIICANCKKEVFHHSKGMCTTCYKKLAWKPKLVECKRCHRNLPHHSKGLCGGCYCSVFRLDSIKEANYKKWHNIDLETYKKITKSCVICGFDKIVELHHLDRKKDNSSDNNLIGLCPNHHKMIHNRDFHEEALQLLKDNGFECKEYFKPNSAFHEADLNSYNSSTSLNKG